MALTRTYIHYTTQSVENLFILGHYVILLSWALTSYRVVTLKMLFPFYSVLT